MCIVSVNIPEAVRQNTRMDTAATTDFACQMVAVAYYLRLHQPLSDCAKIARMNEDEFVQLLHASGIDADALRLLSDLQEGYRSGEEKGWYTTDQVRTRRIQKRMAMERAAQ